MSRDIPVIRVALMDLFMGSQVGMDSSVEDDKEFQLFPLLEDENGGDITEFQGAYLFG